MGRGEENLFLGVDAGNEARSAPWFFRWHLGDREAWSPGFKSIRPLLRLHRAGQPIAPYLREHEPALAAWLDVTLGDCGAGTWRLVDRVLDLHRDAHPDSPHPGPR